MDGATLIVGDQAIGDMILAHGLLQTLKEREPDIPIDIIATERNASIALLFPEIRKVLVRPGKTAGAFKINRGLLTYLKHVPLRAFNFPRMLYQIKRGNYHKAFILRTNSKDAWGPYLMGVPERISYLSIKNSQVLLTKSYPDLEQLQHKSYSITRLGYPAGSSFETPTPALSIPAEAPAPLPSSLLPLAESGKLVAFCPGGTVDGKKWPAEHFGQLAAWLLDKGFKTIILGASEDRAMARRIVESSPARSVHDLTGNFNLIETITVLSRCHTLISNDTGLMHAAAALGIITLGIFMFSNPVEWSPLGPAAHFISTYVDGCETGKAKPPPPPPPSTEQVIAKLEELL